MTPIGSGIVRRFSMAAALVGLAACSQPQADTARTADTAAASAPAASSAGTQFTGKVAETMSAGGYTYVRLQSADKEIWIAGSEFPVTKDEQLTVALDAPMANFHSPTLNRDFPLIYFVAAIAREGQTLPAMTGGSGSPAPMSSHGSGADAGPMPSGPVTVQPNAPPAGGRSIADVWAKRKTLDGTEVTVRGTVVKVNNGIMDRNWFHLQDGSGKADDGTNDLTITSDATVKLGDVVTVTGTVGVDKDFSAGYAYAVMLEKARIR